MSNRFQYYRIDEKRGYCAHVIVELGDDPLDEKCMRFFDQEYNEVRWYEFAPGDAEIEEVKRLISQSSRYSWLDCVRIDMSQVRTKGQPLVMSAGRTDGAPDREVVSGYIAT